jgi:hypothetical protein
MLPMRLAPCLVALFCAAVFLHLVPSASAQTTTTTTSAGPVAVFRLSFEKTGDSINYRPYQNGYYVAPIEGGAGSLILTLVTAGQRQYFTYPAFGEMFVAVKGKEKRMVLSATAANTVSTTVFYAIGDTDKELHVESRNSTSDVKVAEKMTGFAVSADSEKDLPFSGSGTSVGVAGASILTVTLDDTLTNVAIRDSVDTDGEVDVIIAILESAGYVNGTQTATNGGGTNGGNGTTNNGNGGTQPN